MSLEREELVLADVKAWRAWLEDNHSSSPGIWLVLAKKGVAAPTTVSYAQALEEALCFGWIDGQAQSQGDVCHSEQPEPLRDPVSDRHCETHTRTKRIAQFAAMLERGETIYPQKAGA